MELKVITFENNTVAQQIEKVQGAAVVVLERGAAMANCAYMSPGSAVLYIDGNPVVGKSGRHDNSVWMVPKTGDVEVTRAATATLGVWQKPPSRVPGSVKVARSSWASTRSHEAASATPPP